MLNKVTLIGFCGKNPEVNYLESGTAIAKLTLATSEKYKDKNGERVESTEWHNLIAWRQKAELIEKYVKKGDLLHIEGKIQTRNWTNDKQEKKYFTVIIVTNIIFLKTKGKQDDDKPETKPEPEDPNQGLEEKSRGKVPGMDEPIQDDLPF